jgi:three-Cys-motif partner protein
MAKKHYDWRNGPAAIQQHSVVKHRLLQAYLADYFTTLAAHPGQEKLSLTLVDGFAGGGRYIHENTRDLVPGSPLICLQAVREAEFLLNETREKPLRIDANYFFIEANRQAHAHLIQVLGEEGYGPALEKNIFVRRAKFQDQAHAIIEAVRRKNPRNGRSIFILDQYGYSDVPTDLIRSIFGALKSAEVILTFGVDSFLNYASDNDVNQALLDKMGVPGLLKGRTWAEIKSSGRDWRLWIQGALYQELVTHCGASFYTPFFIRNSQGHGDYWLLHMSQHPRARDVMTELHWRNHNHFIHYGGAGLDMFQAVGYDPDQDSAFRQQFELGFAFDDVARKASISALMEQIPSRIATTDTGTAFGELFAATCNDSPASMAIYRTAIERLSQEKVLTIISPNGGRRQSANTIKPQDQILLSPQRSFFLPQHDSDKY